MLKLSKIEHTPDGPEPHVWTLKCANCHYPRVEMKIDSQTWCLVCPCTPSLKVARAISLGALYTMMGLRRSVSAGVV